MLKKKYGNIFNLIVMKWANEKIKNIHLDGFWWAV
jgi:hypothetical protein